MKEILFSNESCEPTARVAEKALRNLLPDGEEGWRADQSSRTECRESAEAKDLQDQLKTLCAERDRFAFEKLECALETDQIFREHDELRKLVERACAENAIETLEASQALADMNELASERDAQRQMLATLSAERDRLIFETKRLRQANRDTVTEIARLLLELERARSVDPMGALRRLSARCAKTLGSRCVALTLSNGPGLLRLCNKAAVQSGAFLAQSGRAFFFWVVPRARDLYLFLKGEIASHLAAR